MHFEMLSVEIQYWHKFWWGKTSHVYVCKWDQSTREKKRDKDENRNENIIITQWMKSMNCFSYNSVTITLNYMLEAKFHFSLNQNNWCCDFMCT